MGKMNNEALLKKEGIPTDHEILEGIIEKCKSIIADCEVLLKPIEEPVVSQQAIVTLEEVRKVLVEKSREGFRAEVKKLIQSYGCEKLTDIDPQYYGELMIQAGGIGNE